jgi:HAD superfamily hydrolase (TIGR01490 family)
MGSRKNRSAVFIDLDGTLCEIYLWEGLFTHHRVNRYKRGALFAFMAFHFPIWLLYEANILSKKYFYTIHATNLAWLVKGVSVARADQIWDWIIENQTLPRLRLELKDVINTHKSNGQRIYLISGSFLPFLEKLATVMNITGVIATPLEEKDGRYTGKIIPPLTIGTGKLERLNQFLESDEEGIDLSISYFYTDSSVDIPVMELFGYPIAVYPDKQLAEEATKRGWSIIDGIQKNHSQ